MASVGNPSHPIKKCILQQELYKSNAFTLMADELQRAKTIESSTEKLKLLSAAESVEVDMDKVSQEHLDLLASFVASYLQLPPGEQVFVGPYKDSIWHKIAQHVDMPVAEALRKVLRWPSSSTTKISFFTKREDDKPPMFPLFKLPDVTGQHMHVLDILRAVGEQDPGDAKVAHVSLQRFVGALKSVQRAENVKNAASSLVSLHEQA